jgi:predicted  nucleic acid-binding Zn-ribbon protein
MSPVAATQLPVSRLHVDWKPVRDTLAALRAGHESLDLFVGQLFSGFEAMRERLDQHDRRIKEERRQLALERERLSTERTKLQGQSQTQSTGAASSGEHTVELEQERVALEEELESVRQRCEELSGTVAEQKRQLAEERAEWTAEFRQLRKILDKQSQILAQRVEHHAPAQLAVVPAAVNCAAPNGAPVRGAVDPVLGSVMTQFQLLQKDAARRRAQHAKNKAS